MRCWTSERRSAAIEAWRHPGSDLLESATSGKTLSTATRQLMEHPRRRVPARCSCDPGPRPSDGSPSPRSGGGTGQQPHPRGGPGAEPRRAVRPGRHHRPERFVRAGDRLRDLRGLSRPALCRLHPLPRLAERRDEAVPARAGPHRHLRPDRGQLHPAGLDPPARAEGLGPPGPGLGLRPGGERREGPAPRSPPRGFSPRLRRDELDGAGRLRTNRSRRSRGARSSGSWAAGSSTWAGSSSSSTTTGVSITRSGTSSSSRAAFATIGP